MVAVEVAVLAGNSSSVAVEDNTAEGKPALACKLVDTPPDSKPFVEGTFDLALAGGKLGSVTDV